MRPGTIISASPTIGDPVFEGSIVIISEVNSSGAIGFVINRSFGRHLNDLVEFANAPSFPLSDGGPVDREGLFILHRRPDLITGGELVADGIYIGGKMNEVVSVLNSGIINKNELKIFVGYCGWDHGELEEEIQSGSWSLTESVRVFE